MKFLTRPEPLPTILLTNLQSLWNKIDEIRLVLHNSSPDLALLTETWLTDEIDSDLIGVQGYSIARADRIQRKGGGTAVLIRNTLPFKASNVSASFDNEAEGTLVELTSWNLTVLCVYIPPNLLSSSLANIRNEITNIADNCLTANPSIRMIIAGDFNKFDVKLLASDLDLVDIINYPTRDNNILDHILIHRSLSSAYEPSCVKYNAPIGKADHKTLIATPKTVMKLPHNFASLNTVFDYRRSNIAALRNAATRVNWESVFSDADDIDSKWSKLHTTIVQLLDKTIPQHSVVLTTNDKNWMTPLTKLLINQKWEAFRMRDWTKYAHLKAKVKIEVTKAKTVWCKKLRTSKNGLWKLTKHLSGKASKKSLDQRLFADKSPELIAEEIAHTFAANQTPRTESLSLDDSNDWDLTIPIQVVEKHLFHLPASKACGSDGIPNKIYSLLSDFIAGPLQRIFQHSVSQRVFPDSWKKGLLVPIPKTNPPQLDKLRAITLLHVPSKILERIVLENVRNKIERLYGPYQHAFRRNASTVTALIHITDTVLQHYDNTSLSGFTVLSFDLTQAFDKVNHSILINKLLESDLPRGFVQWTRSYLSNRQVRVKMQRHLSMPIDINEGVPQGSVLGPALFCVMVGDFFAFSPSTSVTQYADDLTMVLPIEAADAICASIKKNVEAEWENFKVWCHKNKQQYNACKSQLMVHTRSQVAIDQPMPINVSNDMKILGVRINKWLNWDDHVNHMYKNACRRLYILRVLKPHLQTKDLHEVYIAYIRSILEYCAPVFIGLNAKLSKQLQRVDNRAHRLIYGDERHCSCGPHSLKERREEMGKQLLQKIISSPDHILKDKGPNILPHNRRFSAYYCRTDKRSKSFFPLTTHLINGDL